MRSLKVALVIVPALAGAAEGQSCHTWSRERAAIIGGVYVAGQTVAFASRGGDWFAGDARRDFRVRWDGTPALGQDYLLRTYSGYLLSKAGAAAWQWACIPNATAAWLGAGLSILSFLPKEVADGFHSDGFSLLDMFATTTGAILPALQRTSPQWNAVLFKANYWPSPEFRNRVGDQPQLESDYAGWRVFLAFDPALAPDTPEWWPSWLGVAVGHSIEQWIANPPEHQWYFALDLNARGIPIAQGWWPFVAFVIDHVKLPLPGVRLQGGRISFGLF